MKRAVPMFLDQEGFWQPNPVVTKTLPNGTIVPIMRELITIQGGGLAFIVEEPDDEKV
jgi:hypothetical protein